MQVYEAEWKRLKSTLDAGPDFRLQPSFFESIRSSPAAYKPMAILVLLLLLQQLTGAYPTISYALPILKTVMPTAFPAATDTQSLAVLGAVRFMSSLLACMLSFHVGRKPLLMLSCVAMALSSALVATTQRYRDATAIPWPLCGVMLYVFSSSIGVIVFPWTMICELLSTPVRAVGGSLLVSYAYLLMFAVLKAFPYVLTAVSVPNVYLMFGAVSFSMAVYVYFVVPETLGKSFQEIEEHFTRPNKPQAHSQIS